MRVHLSPLLLVVGLATGCAVSDPIDDEPTAGDEAAVGTLAVGIADSDATTFTNPHFAGLGVGRARAVVPYDIASRDPGDPRLQGFEAWHDAAVAAHVEPLVTLGPSGLDGRIHGQPVAPNASKYEAGFQKFRGMFPDITLIGAWNEPNFDGPVLENGMPLSNPECAHETLERCGPMLAAFYFRLAENNCADCTVVAGDFAGDPNGKPYWSAYRKFLRGHQPKVWAIHPHHDLNRYQAGGHHCVKGDNECTTRNFVSWLDEDDRTSSAHVWLDEVGAFYRDGKGADASSDRVWGEASQADAIAFLLRFPNISHKITRIYVYNYQEPCTIEDGSCGRRQDRGLLSPASQDGHRRAAFSVIANR